MERNRKFRFPISRNFSITGQPISRLISGDVPESYAERIALFDDVLEKFESVYEGHEKARAIALASQTGGPGFALYLRNFAAEEFRYSDDPLERAYNLHLAQFEKMIRGKVERAGSAMLSLRGGSDYLDEFLGRAEPVFTGQLENWQGLAAELIEAAKVIVILATDVSPGLLQELEIIQTLQKMDRTMVFVAQGAKTLAELLNQEEDPALLASLKARFKQFENVYEPPQLQGWQPGLAENIAEPPAWSGATRLDELLTDRYASVSDLRVVRVAPFQMLSPLELQSTDHQSAKEYLKLAVRQLREGLRSLKLKAPLAQSVLGDQPDSNYLGLRLAHQAFGIGAALEDYAAMLESLAGIGEIYTYLLANPSAGDAHIAYAFRLLQIRNYEGSRAQDPAELQGSLHDYVREYGRERIGKVYYALARIRRAQGEPDDARAAFEASVAVREPLHLLSARKGVAATLHSLAGLLHAEGKDAEAKVVIERAISIKEAIYGSEANEEVAASLHNLGSILLKLGNLEDAEVAISRSLDMKKKVFGTTHHVSVAETALLVAWLLIQRGGWSEAMPILRFAQSVFRDLAPGSPQLAQIDALLAR